MRKGGVHRWSQSPHGRYTPGIVLFVLCSVVQLTAVTNAGDPRNFLAAGSSRSGERWRTFTRIHYVRYERNTYFCDDYKSHDGFRHLASNSLDHGRAPPRPANCNSNFQLITAPATRQLQLVMVIQCTMTEATWTTTACSISS
uniref:Secreted protein n=1 Tax=Mesocestoides corti TaxID=53468 RepID=A0A5K3FNL6_MESCO